MRWLWILAVGFTLLTSADATASAEKRVALVIGNGAYADIPHLPNPLHDAEDVAAALKRVGFETILGTDLDQAGMIAATIRFARAVRTADVAIFYYSGHAMQYAGVNYLAPVDAQLADEADLRRMARVDDIIADLQQAKVLRILVLDSCRDNPLADQLKRSIGGTRGASILHGLARIDSPEGMITSYATQAGRTADDGNGRNSPYTTAFLRHIEEQDEIGAIFRRIGADVYESTEHTQVPELSISFNGEFYLRGRANTPPAATDPCVAAGDHWKSAEAIGTVAAFEDHLARFPNCAFAGLAKVRIESLKGKVAALPAPAEAPDDMSQITDPALLRELRERLYELNFDPGAFDGPNNEATRRAIRTFERQNNRPPTAVASLGLLRQLRTMGSLKPWGAIVYDKDSKKWGMAWGQDSRKGAVARAQASCRQSRDCPVEVSFFGAECGVFVHSGVKWAITARDDIGKAKEAALADCRSGGNSCQVIASVCADGTQRFGVGN